MSGAVDKSSKLSDYTSSTDDLLEFLLRMIAWAMEATIPVLSQVQVKLWLELAPPPVARLRRPGDRTRSCIKYVSGKLCLMNGDQEDLILVVAKLTGSTILHKSIRNVQYVLRASKGLRAHSGCDPRTA